MLLASPGDIDSREIEGKVPAPAAAQQWLQLMICFSITVLRHKAQHTPRHITGELGKARVERQQ